MSDQWHGIRIHAALLNAEIVCEYRVTDLGIGPHYFLKLEDKMILVGRDADFAFALCFAVRRDAQICERELQAAGAA